MNTAILTALLNITLNHTECWGHSPSILQPNSRRERPFGSFPRLPPHRPRHVYDEHRCRAPEEADWARLAGWQPAGEIQPRTRPLRQRGLGGHAQLRNLLQGLMREVSKLGLGAIDNALR